MGPSCFICQSPAVLETGFAGQKEGTAFNFLVEFLGVPWIRSIIKGQVSNSEFCDPCEFVIKETMETIQQIRLLEMRVSDTQRKLKDCIRRNYGGRDDLRSESEIVGKTLAQCWTKCYVNLTPNAGPVEQTSLEPMDVDVSAVTFSALDVDGKVLYEVIKTEADERNEDSVQDSISINSPFAVQGPPSPTLSFINSDDEGQDEEALRGQQSVSQDPLKESDTFQKLSLWSTEHDLLPKFSVRPSVSPAKSHENQQSSPPKPIVICDVPNDAINGELNQAGNSASVAVKIVVTDETQGTSCKDLTPIRHSIKNRTAGPKSAQHPNKIRPSGPKSAQNSSIKRPAIFRSAQHSRKNRPSSFGSTRNLIKIRPGPASSKSAQNSSENRPGPASSKSAQNFQKNLSASAVSSENTNQGSQFQSDDSDEESQVDPLAVSDSEFSATSSTKASESTNNSIPSTRSTQQESKSSKSTDLNSKLHCKKCRKTFSNSDQLESHLKTHHLNSSVSQLTCTYCGINFKQDCVLPPSEIEGSKVYKCPIAQCSQKFEKLTDLTHHHRPECKRVVEGIKKISGETKFDCHQCSKSFKKLLFLQNHIRANHTSGTVTCKHCGLNYKEECLIPEPDRTPAEQYRCPDSKCSQKFTTLTDLRSHHIRKCRRIRQRHRNVCPHCGKKYFAKTFLQAHIDSVHLKKFKFICDICGAGFNIGNRLTTHMDSVHDMGRDYECDVCEMRFVSPSKLAAHRKKHGDDPLYKCFHCDQIFFILKSFHLHHQAEHKATGDPKFPCRYCNEVLDSSRSLHCHLRRHHPVPGQEEEHMCDQCGEPYGTLKQLELHQKFCHGNNDQGSVHSSEGNDNTRPGFRRRGSSSANPCKECGEIFMSQRGLEKHAKIAHGIAPCLLKPRDFICDLCGKDFQKMVDLNRHHETLHNSNPVACPICKEVRQSPRYLQTHIFRIHGEDWRKWIDKETGMPLPQVNPEEFQEQKWQCELCGKEFTSQYALDNHRKLIHFSDPVACPICGRLCRNKKQVRNHVKKSHKEDPKNWFKPRTGVPIYRDKDGQVIPTPAVVSTANSSVVEAGEKFMESLGFNITI